MRSLPGMKKSSPYWLDAGAMYYAITVSVLFSLISAAFLWVGHIETIEQLKLQRKERVRQNLMSAQNILLGDTGFVPMNASVAVDLFGEEKDSIRISRRRWGLMEVGEIEAFSGSEKKKKTCFIGKSVSTNERWALVLADRNRALALAGETIIKGNCQLPEAGVKRAYIGNRIFKGKELVDGKISRSEKNIPKLLELEHDSASMYRLASGSPELKSWDETEDRIPFSGSPELLEIDSPPDHISWRGQLLVVSSIPLLIGRDAKIQDAIVVAPVIRIQSGFDGCGQFFASDSLILEEDVQLHYPSAAVLNKSNAFGDASLILEENSRVQGVVALLHKYGGNLSQNFIRIRPDARVDGLLYCDDILDHQGIVMGSVYTSRILLQTPSAIYENHLLDAKIDVSELHPDFALPESVQLSGQRSIAKWL